MKLLHTEASPGWGGQEVRILKEAEGMRARGHEIVFAIQKDGGLVEAARRSGFLVYEITFSKKKAFFTLLQLLRILYRHNIQILNTHSSLDAWIGGIAARIKGCRILRTRHLSTPIRKGINSYLLYNTFADYVVTTCEETAIALRIQASLSEKRCLSIPTGIEMDKIVYDAQEREAFRARYGIKPTDCLVGTLCILRGWKGVSDLLHAAKLLETHPHIKWIVVGSGVSESYFLEERKKLGLQEHVIFTGYLAPPYTALAAMDIFVLLSWANEGVSQASLQAAALQRPLITTQIGGLSEVCIPGKTGLHVPPQNPAAVAEHVKYLFENPEVCEEMGKNARKLVRERFSYEHMLDQMEALY